MIDKRHVKPLIKSQETLLTCFREEAAEIRVSLFTEHN